MLSPTAWWKTELELEKYNSDLAYLNERMDKLTDIIIQASTEKGLFECTSTVSRHYPNTGTINCRSILTTVAESLSKESDLDIKGDYATFLDVLWGLGI